jgi:hypothetical protein
VSPRRWRYWRWRPRRSWGAGSQGGHTGGAGRRGPAPRPASTGRGRHDALAAPQLAAPAPIQAAYREVVGALVAMLGRCNEQVAAVEQQLAARFGAHPDSAIVQSLPGLGVVLGARVLAEFGDDPHRYATAKGRKAFAGTAPVTRSSGPRTTVVARAAGNQRLVDACYLWAFAALSASPSAALLRRPPRPRRHPPSGATSLGQPAGRHSAWMPGLPGRLPGADRLASRPAGGLSPGSGGCRGVQPPAILAAGIAQGPAVPVGQRYARSSRGAKEVGRLPGCRRRRLSSQLVSEERLDHGHGRRPACCWSRCP